jgi:nucleoside-diphosphate-sugar epimerase
MIIAVTGSSGFTGRKLVKHLTSLNHEVIKIDTTEGLDATDFNSLKEIPKFDIIFHLAAKSYVPDSYQKPQEFYYTNFNATLNTLELCRKYNAKYIYISSYVYGNPEYLPIDENHPIVAFNPYADTKLLGENLCRSYNKFFDLNAIIVRPFNIYGPGQTPNFLISSIFKQAISGKIELNDPNPKRDLIYIDDLIRLYESLINFNDSPFEIFNAGYGKSYSVREIVESITKLFPSKIEVNFLNKTRKNEVHDTISNNNKAKTLLNWAPQIDLPEGLSMIYSEMK